VQGRCTGLETRALLAAILSCHGSLSISEENVTRSFLLFFFDTIIAPSIVSDTEHRLKCTLILRAMASAYVVRD
jgi:hypothetical protein